MNSSSGKRVSFRDGHPWPHPAETILGREPLKETLLPDEGIYKTLQK